jgi:hypothetical protein
MSDTMLPENVASALLNAGIWSAGKNGKMI